MPLIQYISQISNQSSSDLNLRPQEHNMGPIQLPILQMDSCGHRLYYGMETKEWLIKYTKADFRNHASANQDFHHR